MTTRLARALPAALLLLLGGSALAAKPAGSAERSYRGKVQMSSSAVIPGLLPAKREVDLHMKVTRLPGQQIRIVTSGETQPGMVLRVDATGTILKTTKVPGGEQLHVDFKGEDYRKSVETGLNGVLGGMSVARGVHVPITSATGSATLTLIKNRVSLETTSTVERAKVGGLRGMAVNRLLPSRITNGFQGDLDE